MGEILQKWNCSGNHFCHLSHGRWFPNIFILFENVWQLSPRAEVGESNGKSFSKFLLSHHSKCHTKIKLENCAKFDFNLRAFMLSGWNLYKDFNLPSQNSLLHLPHISICLFTHSNLNLVMKNKGKHCQRTQASQSLTSTSTLQLLVSYSVQHFSLLVCMTPVWRGLQENVWFSVFWFVCLHGFAPNYGCYKMDSKIDILDISQQRNCKKRGGRIFF